MSVNNFKQNQKDQTNFIASPKLLKPENNSQFLSPKLDLDRSSHFLEDPIIVQLPKPEFGTTPSPRYNHLATPVLIISDSDSDSDSDYRPLTYYQEEPIEFSSPLAKPLRLYPPQTDSKVTQRTEPLGCSSPEYKIQPKNFHNYSEQRQAPRSRKQDLNDDMSVRLASRKNLFGTSPDEDIVQKKLEILESKLHATKRQCDKELLSAVSRLDAVYNLPPLETQRGLRFTEEYQEPFNSNEQLNPTLNINQNLIVSNNTNENFVFDNKTTQNSVINNKTTQNIVIKNKETTTPQGQTTQPSNFSLQNIIPTPQFSENLKSDEIRVLKILRQLVNEIVQLTFSELRRGRAELLGTRLQKLQQLCFRKKLQSKQIVTRILLIFSRVARLAHHLEIVHREQESPRKTVLSKSAGFVSSQTFLLNDSFEQMISGEHPEGVTSICRVCEESIPTAKLEAHIPICAKAHQAQTQISYLNIRLSKYSDAISQKISAATPQDLNTSFSRSLSLSHVQCLKSLKSVIERAVSASPDQYEKTIQTLIGLLHELKKVTLTIPSDDSFISLTVHKFFENTTRMLKQKLELCFDLQSEFGSTRRSQVLAIKHTSRPKLSDFEILKPISRGAYGKVFLVKKKKTGDLYAIKMMKKNNLRQMKQEAYIREERLIMSFTQHQLLVPMYYSFQTKAHLYMVMEFEPGGDLGSLLSTWGVFPDLMARQYTAEITLALEYLHSNNIIHRDLKPDNVLIGADGHLKLTDFGLSHFNLMKEDTEYNFSEINFTPTQNPLKKPQLRYSDVGTCDYLAPEVVLCTGHNKAVDWWALGCLIYAFVSQEACSPFFDETREAVHEKIINADIPWPEDPEIISSGAKSLILALLVADKEDRLGSENDAQEIKAHSWFEGYAWENALMQTPAFVPNENVDYIDDTKNQFQFNSSDEEDGPSDELDSDSDFLAFEFNHVSNLHQKTKSFLEQFQQREKPATRDRSYSFSFFEKN